MSVLSYILSLLQTCCITNFLQYILLGLLLVLFMYFVTEWYGQELTHRKILTIFLPISQKRQHCNCVCEMQWLHFRFHCGIIPFIYIAVEIGLKLDSFIKYRVSQWVVEL